MSRCTRSTVQRQYFTYLAFFCACVCVFQTFFCEHGLGFRTNWYENLIMRTSCSSSSSCAVITMPSYSSAKLVCALKAPLTEFTPHILHVAGTLDLTQLAGSDPGPPPVPEPEPPATGIMHAASEAYRFQEMPRMPMATPQAPVIEPETPQHMTPPQFPGQQYLPPAGANSAGSAPYGGLGYYQHYPHAGTVDPYHPHSSDHFVPAMAAPPQNRQPDPYTFPMPPRPVVEPAAIAGEGARKRAADAVVAATAAMKRARTDETAPIAKMEGHPE